MRDRLDPLIDERAPWLGADRLGTRLARRVLDRCLGYDRTVALATHFQNLPAAEVMAVMGHHLSPEVTVTGLEHIPRHGPALVVANHPTGIADGIVLYHLLAPIRPDLFFYANADILRVLPQLTAMIAPVEWRAEKRSHSKTRATMAYQRQAAKEGRLGVIFPSGRLAKRQGLSLHERPWMASAAMVARKFDLPVLPVNIQARNSGLFYLFDLLHPSLRDITLFHETLNKDRQPFRVTIGAPISARALPHRSEAGITVLRRATLGLGGRAAPGVSMLRTTALPWTARRRALRPAQTLG